METENRNSKCGRITRAGNRHHDMLPIEANGEASGITLPDRPTRHRTQINNGPDECV